MSRVDVSTAYVSNTGGRKRNEDSCGYWTSDAGCCWVVSDGAGGHGGGDIASRLVVRTILERFSGNPLVNSDAPVQLLEAAHDAVMNAKEDEAALDMHATCVLLLIDRIAGTAVWGHAGDSRAYLFRNNELVFQTRDHSLVQNMIDAGYGSAELIRTHPQRSLLTSAIGNAGELVVSISGDPVPVGEGDVFLMCSDGWWEYVDETQMQQLLVGTDSIQVWLAAMARQVSESAPRGNDNFTAIAIKIQTTVVESEDTAVTEIFDHSGTLVLSSGTDDLS